MTPVLKVEDLRVSFKTNEGIVKAVRGISFDLYKNETLCIVGESGCGKSVTSKAILSILESNAFIEEGRILFEGKDLLKTEEKELNKIRGKKISMIYQDTLSTLNPIMTVGKQIEEAIIKRNQREKEESKIILKYYESILNKEHISLCTKSNKNEDNIFSEYKDILDKKIKDLSIEYLRYLNDIYSIINRISLLETISDKELKEINDLINKKKNKIKKYQCFNINIFSSFISSFTSLYKSYLKSFSLAKKRISLLNKYNADDYYALNDNIKAKNSEIVLTPNMILKKIKTIVDEFSLSLRLEINNKNLYDINIIDNEINRSIKCLNYKETNKEIKNEVISLLKEVGLEENIYKMYPFELSGGMRQRVVIAISLSCSPEILIADEPTTALDVSIQRQIIMLLERIKKERNLSLIFITHDFSLVSRLADRVIVMYGGKIVEYGTVYDIFYDPRHPYTWALLGSIPDNKEEGKLLSIKGSVPNMLLIDRGDIFRTRNEYALKQDGLQMPSLFKISPSHYAATWLLHEFSKDVDFPEIIYNRIKKAYIDNKDLMPSYILKKNSILDKVKEDLNNGR